MTSTYANLFIIGARLTAVVLFSILTACTESDDLNAPDVNQVSFNQKSVEGVIQADGTITVQFELTEPQTSMQLVAQDAARSLRVLSVVDPKGRELFDASDPFDANSTGADQLQPRVNVLNLPVISRANLRDLAAGVYSATYASALPTPAPNPPVEDIFSLTVVSKQDQDVTVGTVPLLVYVPSAIADSDDSSEAVDNALSAAAEIFQGAGLRLEYKVIRDSTLPSTLPNPSAGSALYKSYSEKRPGRVLMFIGVSVDRLQSPLNRIGQAGSSPGALTATERSAIAISLSAASGSDGVIDSEQDRRDPRHTSELRLLAETISHELMHYLGLQDTLTFNGSSVVASDSTDSPKCPTLEACRLDEDAPHNVMFPYPLNRTDEGNGRPRDQDDLIPREFVSTLQEVALQLALGTE